MTDELVLELRFGPDGARLDAVLLEALRKELPGLSRARLKDWFREGAVLIAGRPADPALRSREGSLSVRILRWDDLREASHAEARPAREPDATRVVYLDEELLVLDKPSGMPSQPQTPDETETAVGHALALVPNLRGVGRGGFEPGLLHRLDIGTSGLLAFARTRESYEGLFRAWKDRRVEKTYRAFCVAPLGTTPPPGTIDFPISHDARSDRRMLAHVPGAKRVPETRGRPHEALTEVRTLARRERDGVQCLDLEVRISTGVMHQIRCHLASIGWPIAGDPIYRGIPSERLWLHAWKLALPLSSGLRLVLEAALPPDWPSASS